MGGYAGTAGDADQGAVRRTAVPKGPRYGGRSLLARLDPVVPKWHSCVPERKHPQGEAESRCRGRGHGVVALGGLEVARMAEDYRAAALRHLTDAAALADRERWGGAGHLVGFAAECAIKYGITTLRPQQDAPPGHFPEIANAAKRHLMGRRDTTLHAILKLPNLMAGWTISLRYEDDAAVGQADYDLWQAHAARLVGAVGLRRPS